MEIMIISKEIPKTVFSCTGRAETNLVQEMAMEKKTRASPARKKSGVLSYSLFQ